MTTITLEVYDKTDVVYQNLSPENKQRLYDDICALLKSSIANARAHKLKKILDEIGKESGNNLNAEVLGGLLHDED